jgi:YYY domain-containing protein
MINAVPQVVLALRWYLVVQAFGLAAAPLCLRLFRHLPDRGYGVSKPLGLLLAGWLFWLLTTLGWLHNTAGGVLFALFVVALTGLALYLSNRPANQLTNRPIPWRTILFAELVFALAFAAWCVVRAYMPRIETAGGEKWMEIAFLRAILRSDAFPPHDPWLSGFAISYYYFGYVIVAMVTRLAAVPPSIAFNLGIAMLFALTCTGAFSLVYNLVVAGKERLGIYSEASGRVWRDIVASLLGPLLLAVMGNLEALMEMLYARGIGSAAFWEWLDVRALAESVPVPFAEGSWIPARFFWWWQASRVVRDRGLLGEHQEVIDEFPAFSFLLGDMHPHVLGLPFVLLAIALALDLYLRVSDRELPEPGRGFGGFLRSLFSDWPFADWELFVCAVCLGGLGFLNTWDFPIYLFIVAAAYALAHLRAAQGMKHFTFYVLRSAALFVSLLASGFLLYQPFWRSFQSQVGGIYLNLFNGTRLPQFLLMFGPLLFIAAAFVSFRARRSHVQAGRVAGWTLGVAAGIVGVLVLVVGLVALLIRAGMIEPRGAAVYVDAWLRGEPLPGVGEIPGLWTLIRQRVILDQQFFESPPAIPEWAIVARAVLASSVWVILALLAFLVLVALTWKQAAAEGRPLSGVSGFVLLLFATGALLAFSVELVYIKDFFGTRMNTVFKFYFQAWILWAIGGAYALVGFIRKGGLKAVGTLFAIGVTFCLAVTLTDGAITPLLLAKVDLPAVVYLYGAGFLLAWCIFVAAFICVATALVRRGGWATAGILIGVTALGVAGLLFPALAIPKRADEYGGPATLDGAAYLAQDHAADYAAIAWLDEHVGDAPVILETPGGDYVYEGRVSAHTGLPTVLGWAGHEHQWRGTYDEQARRQEDITTLYTSVDAGQVLTLLDKYGISYVYVGPLERDLYPIDGLTKFAGLMEVVYNSGGVVIYKR